MSRKRPAASPPAAADCRLDGALTCALLFAWWLGLGIFYYHQPELKFRWDLALRLLPDPFAMTTQALWRLIRLLAELGWLVFLGAGLGKLVTGRAAFAGCSRGERWGFSIGAGWGALGCLLALLGMLRLWYPVPILAALLALTAWTARQALRSNAPSPQAAQEPWSWLDLALVAALAAFAGMALLGTLIPEIFYDALTYQLALPDLYLRRHGFFPTPENIFSGMPMLVQMLFALALPIGGDALARLIHWAFGIMSALMAFEFGRRFCGRRTGLLAALLFYSNPLVGVISWKSAVDLGSTYFQFLAVYALAMAFLEKPASPRWLALSGLLAGFAMGTKYQTWPLAGVMAAVLLWRLWARREPGPAQAARAAAWFIGSLSAALAVWPLRGALLYGNPLFPFYQERFAAWGTQLDWRAMLKDGGVDLHAALTTWPGFRELLRSPWFLSTQQLDSRSFGPMFLLGLPLLALVRFRTEAERILWACAVALCAVWCLTSTVPRYFLPAFILAAVLFASAFERGLPPGAKRAGYALLAYVVCANFFWIVAWFQTYEAEAVVMGRASPAEYLSQAHPSYGDPYYPCARYISENLPAKARVLIVGDERGYYLDRDNVAPTAFVEHPLARYLKASQTPGQLRDSLARDGVTHLLVNAAKIRELGLSHWVALDARQQAVYDAYFRGAGRPLFESLQPGSAALQCAVYEVGGREAEIAAPAEKR